MTLNTLWFILISVLFTGFFILEGFDFGVGLLMPFLGKTDLQRRTIINTIGPHWDGNEVWLITAGGAIFAAFPNWYATMFSGFYLPLFLLLIGLIIRGVAFEFRSKDDNPLWRKMWDWCIFAGSLIPTILLPVAFANLLRGIPIDANMQYVGGFFNLLNPYALLAALTLTLVVLFHGASFLSLKTTGEIEQKAKEVQRSLWLLVVLMLIIFLVTSFIATGVQSRLNALMVIFPLVGVIAIVAAGILMNRKQFGWVFVASCLAIGTFMATIFSMLYPNVIVSSLSSAWNLTIQNAASSPATLKLMTTITLIFLPIVLAYQAWAYWVFRKRVTGEPKKLTY